ncbi:hypothetical protein ACROYT_G030292 [Oculina patagonica]
MAAEAKKEEAKRIRTSAKSRFTRKRNEFLKSIQDNKGMNAVKRTFADLHEAWNIVEGKHDIYMIHLTEDEIGQNEAWINELQELYEEAATAHAQRLDEKYGDPAKVADVIMCAIQNMRPIREGESKKFVELINVIDGGYRDLKRLGLEKEITTTSSVSIIERKLPNDVKREWAKLVSSEHSPVDKRDKFPSLLRFLLEQKQAKEYENAELRSSGSLPLRGSLHYLEKKNDKVAIPEGQGSSRYKRTKCLYHEGANHWTNEWRVYLSKSVQERLKTESTRKSSNIY